MKIWKMNPLVALYWITFWFDATSFLLGVVDDIVLNLFHLIGSKTFCLKLTTDELLFLSSAIFQGIQHIIAHLFWHSCSWNQTCQGLRSWNGLIKLWNASTVCWACFSDRVISRGLRSPCCFSVCSPRSLLLHTLLWYGQTGYDLGWLHSYWWFHRSLQNMFQTVSLTWAIS